MNNATVDGIPQVISIVPVSRDGKVSLKKDVKNYLDGDSKDFYLDAQEEEVLLKTRKSATGKLAELKGYRLCLPEDIVAKLKLAGGSLLAMIQRLGLSSKAYRNQGAVALKKMEIEEREGDRAQVVDFETTHKVKRFAQTNPMPEKLVPRLKEQYSDLELKHDVRTFLRERKTLDAWKARKLIGMVGGTDEQLREELIQERLDKQQDDGSWEGQVVLTARYLRELGELGVQPDADAMLKAASWLLHRPQSSYNPGMFFLADELVEKQASVIKQRRQTKKGTRARFRERRRPEMKLVLAGEDMTHDPCGPRIMWPNALVLEALLSLGYEDNERVQTALKTLMHGRWCECGYQHGFSEWKRTEPPTMDEIEEMEKDFVGQFRYGGIRGLEDVRKMECAWSPRLSHSSEGGMDMFALRMPTHQQPCELITVRAMSQVKNDKMRRLAEAYLWRFAGRQHSPDGKFIGAYKHVGEYFYLHLFASYDHPASKVVIMRSIPWIVNAQNEDGSWGEEGKKDVSTSAVLSAFVSLGDHLPSGLIP